MGTTKDAFEKHYPHLVEFQQQNGHCRVPQQYKPNLKLGRWVNNVRRHGASTFPKKERSLLESIGFEWCVKKRSPWDENFQDLVRYKEDSGTLKIPKSRRRLLNWVNHQRRCYARYLQNDPKSGLDSEKIKKLEDIGFEWYTARQSSFKEVILLKRHRTSRTRKKLNDRLSERKTAATDNDQFADAEESETELPVEERPTKTSQTPRLTAAVANPRDSESSEIEGTLFYRGPIAGAGESTLHDDGELVD